MGSLPSGFSQSTVAAHCWSAAAGKLAATAVLALGSGADLSLVI